MNNFASVTYSIHSRWWQRPDCLTSIVNLISSIKCNRQYFTRLNQIVLYWGHNITCATLYQVEPDCKTHRDQHIIFLYYYFNIRIINRGILNHKNNKLENRLTSILIDGWIRSGAVASSGSFIVLLFSTINVLPYNRDQLVIKYQLITSIDPINHY